MSGEKCGQLKRQYCKLLFTTLLFFGVWVQSLSAEPASQEPAEKAATHLCEQVLRSNCNASQAEYLEEFLNDLELFSITEELEQIPGDMPAFSALPKDPFGMVNWNKSVTDGIIKPIGALEGEEEPYEGFLENLILFQVNVHFMADVLFPHGMHTYWIGCDSCHPKPFVKKNGANKFTMKDVVDGEYCGKCHGKVAFPPGTYKNCRRCHAITKEILNTGY